MVWETGGHGNHLKQAKYLGCVALEFDDAVVSKSLHFSSKPVGRSVEADTPIFYMRAFNGRVYRGRCRNSSNRQGEL